MKKSRLGICIFFVCLVYLSTSINYNRQINSLVRRLNTAQRKADWEEKQLEYQKAEAQKINTALQENMAEKKEEVKEAAVQKEDLSAEIFWLKAQNGKVIVYKEDQNTVYENTGILLSSLPTYLQNQIKMGKFLKSGKELYNFLENYSS